MNEIIEAVIILVRLFLLLSLLVLMGMLLRVLFRSAHRALLTLFGATIIVFVMSFSPDLALDSTVDCMMAISESGQSDYAYIFSFIRGALGKTAFAFAFVLLGVALTDVIRRRRAKKASIT